MARRLFRRWAPDILLLLSAPVLAYLGFGIGQAAARWIRAEFPGGGRFALMWAPGPG